MDRSSQVTVLVAAFLLIFAVLSPFTAPMFTGEDDFASFIVGSCFFGIFFIIGLVVLIVGLTRGSGRRQQQQQQQVIVLGPGGVPIPGAAQTRVKCPTCQHLNPVQARFCTQCATYLGAAKS